MNFTVVSCNPSNGGKTNVVKLVNENVVDLGALGKKSIKQTYYISIPKKVAVGTKVDLDMELLRVQEYPFVTQEGIEMQLKWLHLKGAAQ